MPVQAGTGIPSLSREIPSPAGNPYTANTQAKRAALAHFVFNVFGVIWVLIVFHPFMDLVNWVVDTFFQSSNPEVAISYKLSAFHSIFNICNVCILIWAVKLMPNLNIYVNS